MTDFGLGLKIISVAEPQPGEKLRELFAGFWPHYERWFRRDGGGRRPSYARSMRALREFMPEIVPLYEQICELVDADDQIARFLSLYRPAPFMTGCSQAIWKGQPLALIRNYDYAADFIDGVNLMSDWQGVRVIAMTDCFWGVVDGMNEHGLAAALSFGGRKVVGDGFAIPLILRYILETCRTTEQAVSVLNRVPSHMAYNISLLDSTGQHATVHVAPDRATHVTQALVCTNHQTRVEWPEHASLTATIERETYLNEAMAQPTESYASLVSRFLHPPLYRPSHLKHWRTLYTAAYLPHLYTCSYLWPQERWDQTFENFVEHGTISELLED